MKMGILFNDWKIKKSRDIAEPSRGGVQSIGAESHLTSTSLIYQEPQLPILESQSSNIRVIKK